MALILHKPKSESGVNTRKSLLSEFLCLHFPELYPLLNRPVQRYMEEIEFKAPKGSTEGGRYIDLARKLRAALKQNPSHLAKSIAELDAVIQEKYRVEK